MKLYALSDLHVGHPVNRRALASMPPHRQDWLILAGDVCELVEDLEATFATLSERFAQLLWVPGNHELWTVPDADTLRGQAKYERLVDVCRQHGVLTPEDSYPVWEGEGGPHILAPLFLLYDYSFAPASMSPAEAVAWAAEDGTACVDEQLLHSAPHPSRQAWCRARCRYSEARLEQALAAHDLPTVLINHFPLRRELAVLPRIPRFRIWCGTLQSEDWHRRFRAAAAVYGHLHIRASRVIDGTRFTEVSLGYPGQWQADRGIGSYLTQILPEPLPR